MGGTGAVVMAYHPPAAGGRTAWGVGESKATDTPQAIKKQLAMKEDHWRREEERLQRINAMKSDPSSLLDSRQSRRGTYELSRTSGDDFKNNHLEVLEKMKAAKLEKKLEKKLERKRIREEGGEEQNKKKRKKEKEKEEESSSDVSSDSDSSSSSKASKKSKSEPEEEVVIQLTPEEMLKAAQARAREREVRKKAEEAAQAWAAEQKVKEATAERQRQEEVLTAARRKTEQLEVQKKLEALQKQKEEEAKKDDEETTAKKAEEAEKRKELFKSASSLQKAPKGSGQRGELVIGKFHIGQTVFASKNISVKGQIVIKQNCQGTVMGPSENNPMQRIGVRFSKREDRGIGLMNVVPAEIKKSLR